MPRYVALRTSSSSHNSGRPSASIPKSGQIYARPRCQITRRRAVIFPAMGAINRERASNQKLPRWIIRPKSTQKHTFHPHSSVTAIEEAPGKDALNYEPPLGGFRTNLLDELCRSWSGSSKPTSSGCVEYKICANSAARRDNWLKRRRLNVTNTRQVGVLFAHGSFLLGEELWGRNQYK